ncbi:MAG: hypothetical protein ACH255_16820 [Candidatus Thiodiazotropha sp.]
MTYEKRTGERAIPGNLKEILTELQMMSLNKLSSFGWELFFVRRPLFQAVVPVVRRHDGIQIGVLEADGRINMKPEIVLRKT